SYERAESKMTRKSPGMNLTQFGLVEKVINENTTLYQLKPEDGHGEMLVCKLFPGIDIYYNSYDTNFEFCGKFNLNNFMELSYSYEGVYECILRDNRCIYIGEGELIAFCNIFESVGSHFPKKVYKGFEIMFDFYTVGTVLKQLFKDFSIDFNSLVQKLCKDGNIFIMNTNGEIKEILDKIYLSDPITQISYIRIKVLELLYLLCSKDLDSMKFNCNYYEKSAVEKVKHVREHLTAELSEHITIEQLAREHGLTQTTLKNCFREIYGIPPYEYLKKIRMNHAAILLRKDKYPIGEIAGMVGYQNASKFSKAFRDVLGATPSEYRSYSKKDEWGTKQGVLFYMENIK
ncbi:MAG: AraC family regulatory protein, partial [Anaerocolumna sp.]|nr:AraC family regulatory protein [Anaerocolumna sp.]